jgi:hypothetical protein
VLISGGEEPRRNLGQSPATCPLTASAEKPGRMNGYRRSVEQKWQVGKGRLELPRLAAHDPKSCLSANSSTPPRVESLNILGLFLPSCLTLCRQEFIPAGPRPLG